MPFEITRTGVASFYRGDTSMGYDFGERTVVIRHACVDLEEVHGVMADIITDYRRSANALISEWREFYLMTRRWDGNDTLILTLPNKTEIRVRAVQEGALRRWVQSERPGERVVDKSLRWVIDTYNTEQKEES